MTADADPEYHVAAACRGSGGGHAVECSVLVLWGPQGFVGRGYQPLSVWQDYAVDARREALPTGHFLPEEAPALVIAALREFLD
jgi:haloacetate dehalogenase